MVASVSTLGFTVSNPYTVAIDLKRLGDGDEKDKKIAELSKENEALSLKTESMQEKLENAHVEINNIRKKNINIKRTILDNNIPWSREIYNKLEKSNGRKESNNEANILNLRPDHMKDKK